MALDTFNFPYHTLSVDYPDSSAKIKFGRGYEFATKPEGPDQLTLTLNYDAMFFYESSPGVVDRARNTSINMQLMEDFYIDKRLYTKFYYPHPLWGNTIVRFQDPLKYKIVKGGLGSVESFTLKMVTQP